MTVKSSVGTPQKVSIPDLRFEQTFKNALKREALKNKQYKAKNGTDTDSESPLSASIICKVVLRDVLLLPFLQGALWTGVLIAMRPWLWHVKMQGLQLGRRIYNLVLGKDLVPKRM